MRSPPGNAGGAKDRRSRTGPSGLVSGIALRGEPFGPAPRVEPGKPEGRRFSAAAETGKKGPVRGSPRVTGIRVRPVVSGAQSPALDPIPRHETPARTSRVIRVSTSSGASTFSPPTGRGGFLAACWEGRLSCRPLRIEEDEEEGGLRPPYPPQSAARKPPLVGLYLRDESPREVGTARRSREVKLKEAEGKPTTFLWRQRNPNPIQTYQVEPGGPGERATFFSSRPLEKSAEIVAKKIMPVDEGGGTGTQSETGPLPDPPKGGTRQSAARKPPPCPERASSDSNRRIIRW